MFKKVLAILLIACVMSANFSRLFIYAGFELNRNYIATHLCENRDKPWLHCNGKCYFMKKIRQAEDKEKSAERQSQKNLIQDAIFTQKAETRFYTTVLHKLKTPRSCISLPVIGFSIFQPPRLG